MKILRITAQGLPLFKKDLDICFYTQQRVCEEDKDSLYRLTDNYYLHSACAFIGINASGKTSVLKVISLALNIVKNEPINHVEAKSILGGAKKATIRTYFYDKRSYVCCLETVIAAKKSKTGEYVYSILSESLWEKPIATVKSKKYLTDFTGMKPVEQRNSDEAYLSDDVSFVIAHNKKANDTVEIFSLLSYTNVNVLPFTEDIPLEVIAFLDPTIEKLCFEQTEGKTFIHLKFKDEEEIILNNPADLEQYLSSGTIKGIITFSMVKEVLHSGGYLLVDEIENHFNKEIVTTLKQGRSGFAEANAGLQPAAVLKPDRDNDTSVIRGPAIRKAGWLNSNGAVKHTAACEKSYISGVIRKSTEKPYFQKSCQNKAVVLFSVSFYP